MLYVERHWYSTATQPERSIANNNFAPSQHFLVAIWIDGSRLKWTNDIALIPDDPQWSRRLTADADGRSVLHCADSLNRGKLFPTGARIATTLSEP
jgi:hypothetical protein